MSTQAKVAIQKQKHPEYYCPIPRCLWRTMVCDPMTRQMKPAANCVDGYCPRHKPVTPREKSTVLEWIRNGWQFPRDPLPPPVPPKPVPGPITVPPSPDNPPRKPGEKGGAE